MKLSILSEATLQDIERRIPILIKKYYPDLPPKQAIKQIELLTALDPTRGKYTEWIVRQYKTNTIRLPEDNDKIKQLLKQFHKNKKQLQNKDINNYTPGGLARALDNTSVSKRQVKKAGRAGKAGKAMLPNGAELVLDKSPYQIIKVTDAKASSILCSGTKWCTANIDVAKEYIEDGPLYLVYRNGERYALAHADSGQMMDIYDDEFMGQEASILYNLLRSVDNSFDRPHIVFEINNNGNRLPDLEPEIVKDVHLAAEYARRVIGGRWPKAEPFIMRVPSAIYSYAKDVIKDRWPEAERNLLDSPYWAASYAKHIIKGPWPEAEDTIRKDEISSDIYNEFLRGETRDIFSRP
jgi:hypothetical protein